MSLPASPLASAGAAAPGSGVRYLAVGAACAAIHNLVMIGGAWLGLHYLVSTVASFVLLVPIGYTLHVSFTFAHAASRASFARYTAAMAANYPLTVALLFALCDLGHVPMVIASPVATVTLVAWNYLASRWAITRRLTPGSAVR